MMLRPPRASTRFAARAAGAARVALAAAATFVSSACVEAPPHGARSGPRATSPAGAAAPAAAPPSQWPAAEPKLPSFVVTTRSTRLTVTGAPSPSEALAEVAVATPRARLPLDVRSVSADGQRARVVLRSAIEVTADVRVGDLGVIVCEPGTLEGATTKAAELNGAIIHVGRANVLSLASPVRDRKVAVRGAVVLRVRAADDEDAKNAARFEDQFRSHGFDAVIDEARLCRAVPPSSHASPNGVLQATEVGAPDVGQFAPGAREVDVPAHTPLAIHDAPGGRVMYTHPAGTYGFTVVELRREGEWMLVADGSGPHLVGWTRARPPRTETGTFADLVGGILAERRLLDAPELRRLPLHVLPAGTEIRVFGARFARLTKPGVARVGRAEAGAVHVKAAVDEDVTVSGWVDASAVGPLVEAAAK